ncbi:MAG TPA: glycoside hydrolase family 3 N-terminal domain-containing protein, partial [Ktedonobacterales bacterium]
GGAHAGNKTILGQFHSSAPPSLAVNPGNNQLLLSWAATSPAQQLTFATSGTGTSWSGAQAVGNETSTGGPSGFAVAASGLPPDWVAWTGTDAARSVNLRVTTSFPAWPLSNNKTTLNETALGGPSLGYVGTAGRMLLGWTGTDAAHHLNLATITTLSLDQRIDAYIARLSTAQRIGQTLMLSVYAPSDTTALNQALAQWHLGSAIIFTNYNGGPLQPTSIAGFQALTRGLQSHANLPLLLATDEEGGTVDRLASYYGGTPSARQLAATGDPGRAYSQAQTDAARMRQLGLNLDFAPVVDVDQGGGIGSSRTFGTTVSTVTTYAGAFLDGLQQHGVAGTLKHWPGLGAATGNPDLTLPTINRTQAQMSATDFAPFRNLLPRQPGMIMVTTVMAPAYDSHNPALLSPTLVGTVLRGQLGYQGVIVTDSLDAKGLITYMQQQGYSNTAQGLAEASVRAFLAGNDLIELPIESDRLAAVAAAMTQAVQSGRISPARLNASVHRIIALKVRLGLLTV